MDLAILGAVAGFALGAVTSNRLVGTTSGFHGESAMIGMAFVGAAGGGYLGYWMVLEGWIPAELATEPVYNGIGGFFTGAMAGFFLLLATGSAMDSFGNLSDEMSKKLFEIAWRAAPWFILLTAIVGAVLGYRFSDFLNEWRLWD